MITLRWSGLSASVDESDRGAALGGEQRRVDVGDLVLDHVGEDALEGGELEHLDVVLGDLAAHLDVDLLGDLAGQRGEDPAELLGERDAGPDVLGDDAALDVDGVGHQLAGQREPDRPGDRDAGLLLRLVGRGAEVRRGHDVVELEERAVGARLGREHVEAGSGDPALLERGVERGLVDDAAAGGVDQDERRLDPVQLLVADQAERLGRLGQVDGHEVGLGEQRVEVDEPDAHLRGAAGLDVGVVGDDRHPERAEPLRDQDADPAEADDADGLLVELDAGVLRPLPLAVAQRRVRRRDVPGGGEHQRDRELGGRDDVGRRRVDDHDAGLGRGADVDVVEPDAGPGDDLEPGGGGERLGVDLGRRADQQRVGVDDRRQQRRAVGAVALADLEVGSQRLDGGRAQRLRDEDDRLAHSGVSDVGEGGGASAARRCASRPQYPTAQRVNRVRPRTPTA